MFFAKSKQIRKHKAQRIYKAYEGSDVSLTPHPEDELDRDVDVTDRMAFDNGGEGWPCTELGELSDPSYGEL